MICTDKNASTEDKAYTCSNEERSNIKNAVTMKSGGTTEADAPNYVEGDDVKDSIAEGYF